MAGADCGGVQGDDPCGICGCRRTSVFVNSVLISAKLLVNGTNIVQMKRNRIVYYHVELPEHAVILAEELT